MSYYVRSDLEPYVGQEIGYIAYLHPMGTSAIGEGRYSDEYEEVRFESITDRCIVVSEILDGKSDSKYKVMILIPIEFIVAFRIFEDVEPKK